VLMSSNSDVHPVKATATVVRTIYNRFFMSVSLDD
jgi:hypothetical protein